MVDWTDVLGKHVFDYGASWARTVLWSSFLGDLDALCG